MSSHGPCHPAVCSTVLDTLRRGSSPALRRLTLLGLALALNRIRIVDAPFSVLNKIFLSSLVPLRSFTCLEIDSLVVCSFHIGAAVFLRRFGQLGSALSEAGFVKAGGIIPSLDYLNFGSSLFTRSLREIGSPSTIGGHSQCVTSSPLLDFCAPGSALALCSVSYTCVFFLSMDFLNLASATLARSISNSGTLLPIMDFFHSGSRIVTRSSVCMPSFLAVMDFLFLGSPSLM